MAETIKYRFLLRGRTAANWTSLNEVLLAKEIGLETDTVWPIGHGRKFKIGDGVTAWNSLEYATPDAGLTLVAGEGISIDDTDPANPIISSTLGSIALSGRVANYASLPTTGLTSGDAYFVESDSLIYIWDGTSFEAEGEGVLISISGPRPGAVSSEILKDGPRGYWKCDEASGTTLADSSGNGYDMTTRGTIALASAAIVPSDDTKYLQVVGANLSGATRAADQLGLTLPYTGSYTVEAIAFLYTSPGSATTGLFAFYASGETLPTNAEAYLVFTGGVLTLLWESGAGVNTTFNALSSIYPLNKPVHVAAVRDSVAGVVRLYMNGYRVSSTAYSTNPSGGTSSIPMIGSFDNTTFSGNYGIAHVAFFDKVLTDERIRAHARAAGF